MTHTQLEIFSLVAELRGFTSTAQHLGISQSAVSHALKSLEKELGVTLLDRNSAQIELTDIGARLLPKAREILGLTETMKQEATEFRGLRSGRLRIGSFGPTSTIRLLPPILDAFAKAYPGIEVRIDEGPDEEVVDWLLERRVDIGFVVLPDDRFETYDLVEDQLVALVPLDHPLAAKETVAPRDMCDIPFIMTEAGSAGVIGRVFSRAGLVPDIRFRTSQVLSTVEMVARGDGVAVVAELALPSNEKSRRYGVRGLNPRHTRTIGLALNEASHTSPAAKAFVKIAEQVARRWER
jgi:DNA-binding transcriptional LysR family regulator